MGFFSSSVVEDSFIEPLTKLDEPNMSVASHSKGKVTKIIGRNSNISVRTCLSIGRSVKN